MRKITVIVLMLFTALSYAQVGINIATPHASAALDVTSTSAGFLPPRMTALQRTEIVNPALGLMVFCTNCASGDGELQVNYASGWKNATGGDITDPPPVIGDIRAGGVVFWVDPSDNRHGLVCAFSDYSTKVQWGCYGIDLPNVLNVPYNGGNPSGSGAEIGDGVSNTNNILIDCSDAPAALAARSVGAQWFLPSAKELNEMYDNRTTLEAISVFTEFSPVYWSSTEFTSNLAWGQNFFSGDGNHSVYTKEATCNVRAVRAF